MMLLRSHLLMKAALILLGIIAAANGQCFNFGQEIPEGQTLASYSKCDVYECIKGELVTRACPRASRPPGNCELTVSLGKPFPHCCPRYDCKPE